MATLIEAMATLSKVFDKYSGDDHDKGTLSKDELAKLLRKEICMDKANKDELDKFFHTLDEDKNGVVNFQEYIVFVATLTMLINAK